MSLYERFSVALPYDAFLDRYGTDGHRARWRAVYDDAALSAGQTALLQRFTRTTHVLVLAGAWCGDCVRQCPIFTRFAEAAPVLDIRYLDRDDHPEAQHALQVNDGNRVPVVVFFSEDGHEVARFGDRTLSTYRQMMADQTGASCSSGIARPGDSLLKLVVQDWLDEFERVQWILRLSPRLRRKHGD